MERSELEKIFDLKGKVITVTGGTGVLGSEIVCCLAEAGARLVVLDLKINLSDKIRNRLSSVHAEYEVFQCDVLAKESLEKCRESVLKKFGKIDALINGAGGNNPAATTSRNLNFFDIPQDAFNMVLQLNLMGTVLPSQIFGRYFATQNQGIILNISSMNAFRPLTGIPAYSAAKAAVSNFTLWLAVHMAREYSPRIRVNAIAPGFFLTDQNRFLLLDSETGELTNRGKAILDHTPAGRFGNPDDLAGTIIWLLSPASSFVTGIVVPVDGGFSAFSGV